MSSLQKCCQRVEGLPKGLTRFVRWCYAIGLSLSLAIWVYWCWRLRKIEMALYYEDVAVTALGHPELVSKWQSEGRIPVSLRNNEEVFRYFAARSLEYDRGVHTKIFLHLAVMAALRGHEGDAEFFYTLFCKSRTCDVGYADWRRGLETFRAKHAGAFLEELKEDKGHVAGKAP